MNLIAGIFIFTLIFNRVGVADPSVILIGDVNKDSPAAISGLLPGDTITRVNNLPIDRTDTLIQIVQQNKGKEIVVTYLRDGKENQIRIIPRVNPPQGQGALGITMTNPIIRVSWYKTIPYAAQITYIYGREMLMLPARLLEGSIQASQARMVSPKGMYDMFSQMQTRDQQATANNETPDRSVNTLNLMAIISIALGITNLLPIPALDGGRIIFVLPELLIKKRIPARYENMVHMIGFLSLLGLQVYITIQDILNPIVIP
jgi:regulator of sigma E protease